MHVLAREEAVEFVLERADVFDAQENPFAHSSWVVHFLRHVARPDWTIIAPETLVGGESMMLLYDAMCDVVPWKEGCTIRR